MKRYAFKSISLAILLVSIAILSMPLPAMAQGRTATFTIAASNAPDYIKQSCDVICTGNNDQVPIRNAMLSIGKGTIHLSAGDFYLFDNLAFSNNIVLEGEGLTSTILHTASGKAIIPAVAPADWCRINQLEINGRYQGKGISGHWAHAYIDHVAINNIYGFAIDLFASTNNPVGAQENNISDCRFSDCTGAIHLGANATDNNFLRCVSWNALGNEDVLIEASNNVFDTYTVGGYNNLNYGIRSTGGFFNRIVNSIVDGAIKKDGILIDSSSISQFYWVIENTIIRACGKSLNNTYAGIHLASSGSNIVGYTRLINNTYHDRWTGGNKVKYGIWIGPGCQQTIITGDSSALTEYTTAHIKNDGVNTIMTGNYP